MGINADSDKKAYKAFRDSDRKDKLGKSLTDVQLAELLKGFIDKHPQFKGVLNTGQALKADEYRQSDSKLGVRSLYEERHSGSVHPR